MTRAARRTRPPQTNPRPRGRHAMTDEIHPLIPILLDDESPPDRRRAAEAAASADPAVAEELRSLAACRDLVAGLSRPGPPDVSSAVLRRIAVRRRFRAVSRVAAAAAVLTAGGLAAHYAGRTRPDRPAPGLDLAPAPAVVATAAPAPPAPAPPAPAAVATSEFVGPSDPRPLVARRLLDHPGPVRMFLATGGRPGDVADVASLIGLSSHRDFHRFDLPADGDRPGATVFAAELDPGELKTLRMRLVDALAEGVEEQDSGPTLLADVARSGAATTLRGDPAAEILVPRGEMAIRIPRDESQPPTDAPPPPSTDAEPVVEVGDGPCVVLIWIPGAG